MTEEPTNKTDQRRSAGADGDPQSQPPEDLLIPEPQELAVADPIPQEAVHAVGKPGPGEKSPSIARTFSVVAVLTVASKILGLLRDIIVLGEYGTSVIADAYNYAYMFTGNVLVLFGGLGGPFHSSTVAIVTPQKDNRDSGLLVCQILALTVVALLVLTGIAYLVAPWFAGLAGQWYNPDVPALAHTYAGQAAVEAVNQLQLPANKLLYQHQFLEQLRIMLPLIVISGVVGVSYGILNVYNKIFWPSLSPAIASVAMIAAVWFSDPSKRLVYGVPLAVGALCGAIGQMVAQVPDISRLPLRWRLTFTPQPGLREYASMLWPAVFSTSVGQLIVYVDAGFAFVIHQQGAWTAIVSSNRLVQLPLGILLTAMLVPILPRFTEQAAANQPEALKQEMRRALGFLWFLSLPMTAILIVIAQPIVEVLFQRGHFDATSTALVTLALLYLAPSIVFYVARDLVTRVFYAYQDSATPYKVALAAIVVKAPLDWFLISTMQSVAGISLATSIITVFNLSLLSWALKRKLGNLGLTLMLRPLLVMAAGCVLCGAATFFVYWGVVHLLHAEGTLLKLAAIALSSAVGLSLYMLACVACRLEEPLLLARRLPVLKRYVQ